MRRRISIDAAVYYAGFVIIGLGFYCMSCNFLLAVKLLPAGLAVMGTGLLLGDI